MERQAVGDVEYYGAQLWDSSSDEGEDADDEGDGDGAGAGRGKGKGKKKAGKRKGKQASKRGTKRSRGGRGAKAICLNPSDEDKRKWAR